MSLLEQILGREVSHKIPIQAGGQFLYQGVGIREGKQAHIASAVEELEGHGVEITKQTTLCLFPAPSPAVDKEESLRRPLM